MPDFTEKVESRARTVLADSPVYRLRQLQVERVGDALMISGNVDTYYHKQMAQEVVRTVCDGVKVVNSISVET